MLKLFSFSVIVIALFSLNVSAQELDEAFLDSLPDGVAKKLKIDLQDQEDVEVLFRGNTSIEANKAILKKIQNQVDTLKTAIEGSSSGAELPRFGESFFSSIQSSFSPINLPNISDKYILDYGDQLTILLTGVGNNKADTSMVQRDGSITIGGLTKVYVRGLEFREAAKAIQSSLDSTMIGVNATTTLSGLRDVQVFLLGEVSSPGLYTLSGSSNILHALNVAGGVSLNGSYRKIEHKRDNKMLSTLDLYDVMVFGSQAFDYSLRSGDIIFVQPKSFEVAISGGVSRQAIFEVLPGETVYDAIKFAGDIAPSFMGDSFVLNRFEDGMMKDVEIYLGEAAKTNLQRRDSLSLPFFQAKKQKTKMIEIMGMVNNPGIYNIKDGDNLSSLLERAGGYKDSAYPYGSSLLREAAKDLESNYNDRIYRDTLNFIVSNPQEVGSGSGSLSLLLEELKNYKPQGRVITEFSLHKIKNDSSKDTMLLDGDVIMVPPMLKQVYLFGEFNQPGTSRYKPSKRLQDYINAAGGLKDTSTNNLIIIDPDGTTHFYKRSFFKPFQKEVDLYPGSVIYVSRDVGKIEGVKFAATFAPILSSLAISLASLNSITND
jgi:protein involved in polysaccharide export with SLBB domain